MKHLFNTFFQKKSLNDFLLLTVKKSSIFFSSQKSGAIFRFKIFLYNFAMTRKIRRERLLILFLHFKLLIFMFLELILTLLKNISIFRKTRIFLTLNTTKIICNSLLSGRQLFCCLLLIRKY